MKYKIKTRLFAALALSGVSFYWPASEGLAQEDGFGFIRPAEPTRQDGQQHNVPPITQAPSNRSAGASAPKAFAASNVFNGAYVNSSAQNVGYAQHVSPSGNQERATTRRVAYNQPQGTASQVPVASGLQAQRDLPPIVNSAQSTGRGRYPQIVQPIEQNELPPIQSSLQQKSNSTLPAIVTPNAGLERLLHPIPKRIESVASSEMIQDEFMLNADSSAINGASKVAPAAAFGASPLFVQDAPPIIGGSVDPGSLPSSDGLLVPGDGSVALPSSGVIDTFPRATPLDPTNIVPQSVLGSGTRNVPEAGSGTRNVQTFGSGTRSGFDTQPRPTYFDSNGQQQPAFGDPGCSTCGNSGGNVGGVSGCSSCGENGCFDQAAVDAMFNTSGSNAYARQYVIAEALYLGRSDGDIFNSNRGSLTDFDFEAGARITAGRRQDSTSGREFQYTGTDKIGQTINTLDPTGSIDSLFVPSGGLVFADIPSFFNATEQSQSKESYFHSLEFNKVKWGWDVIKSYVGLRYIFFDDEYTLFSQNRELSIAGGDFINADPQSGRFQIGTTNNLIGPHIGGELFYDVGYRVSLSGFSRLGAYVNFSQLTETLDNDGVRLVDEEDTNTTVSYTYEAGINAKYRLTQNSQFRLGYNIYFWDRLATVSDNIVNNGAGIAVGPSFFGGGTSDSDSVFINGLSVGFEFYR